MCDMEGVPRGLLQYGSLQSRKPFLPFGETDSLCRQGSLSTKCFKAGDGRSSEQPALISLHIVFLRLHNGVAMELAAINTHWSDEKLYQEARRIVSALIQLITYREYLPIVLGHGILKIFDLVVNKEGYYKGYNVTVNPTITNSFSTAAYRFGHSLVQQSFIRFDAQHRPVFDNVTIHKEFNNRENLHTAGSVDRLLRGLVNQPCQRRDEFLTSELTNHLFETPSFKFGMDLASINIQRGRDHGIPPYTDWRLTCGLSRITDWIDFERVTSPLAARKFRKIYLSVEDVDLFSAGLAEKSVLGGLVGPTFACIIAQQFSNLRKGDRFWFENDDQQGSFTPLQLKQIKSVTFAQILCHTTEKIQAIQPFVFLTPEALSNKRIPCDDKSIGQFNLDAWAENFSKHTDEPTIIKNPILGSTSEDSEYKEFLQKPSQVTMVNGIFHSLSSEFYMPHNTYDINNPNPPNNGFNGKSLNNDILRNAFFERHAHKFFYLNTYGMSGKYAYTPYSQVLTYEASHGTLNVSNDKK